jgi:hypothetical protein
MNAMNGTIVGLEGSGKPLLHTSGSSVIADSARDDYAANQIFEDENPFTPTLDKAVLRYSRTARKLPAPLQPRNRSMSSYCTCNPQ